MTGPVTAPMYPGAAMARNTELVRQWEILREIDGARHGVSIQKLAALRGVHQRTIRRDLEALGRAGFPLWDDKTNGTSMWKLRAKPFARLEETGLGIMELSALYFSRALVTSLAGDPLHDDLDRAFGKLERALPPGCRTFLDRLPTLMAAKAGGHKRRDERKLQEVVSRGIDASLRHRRIIIRYASASSRRTKDYTVEPLRFAYALGGLYLQAFVPEYGEVRTFAVERIRTLAVLDEQFQPRPLPVEPFGHSMGVFSGTPEEVVIEFDADAAPYIREREWHRTQQLTDRPDGSVVVRLHVCVDQPLKQWVLGFGPAARVVAPDRLAAEIFENADRMRARYAAKRPVLKATERVPRTRGLRGLRG
jgi:predicted DNA-binding transcriptional regulator YafY